MQPGSCQKKMIRLFLVEEPCFAAAEQKCRSEYSCFDVSQLSLPRLDGPKSIIGQKQRHILYCREAETEEGVSVCVCVCVCVCVYLLFCQSSCLKAEPPSSPPLPPPAAGDGDINGTRELKRSGGDEAGETAAVQSSGLATDSFRKTQTPWNGELRIKL